MLAGAKAEVRKSKPGILEHAPNAVRSVPRPAGGRTDVAVCQKGRWSSVKALIVRSKFH